MFRDWGFLITEMVVLIILAALLGLFVGWLIWGRRDESEAASLEADRLKTALSGCRSEVSEKDGRIAALEAELAAMPAMPAAPAPLPDGDSDGDATLEDDTAGVKPATLPAARDGRPDDLKMIKGVGPKLEKLCNTLGFFHFDQIAAWTAEEVAWVDANLEGFKGRVTRDDWVAQANTLAQGGETEFSKRVEDGDVY